MKHYGRFLAMWFPMIERMIARIDGDEGGGSDDTGTGQSAEADATLDRMFSKSDALHDEGKADAPSGEQGASGKEGEKGKGSAESSKGQATGVTDEDLEKALSPEESPDAKVERLERDYKASSTEAKRLVKDNKAIADALEKQGLKLSVKDGQVDLIPTDKYSDKPAKLEVNVSELPIADQEALESGDMELIQPIINKLLAKQASALVRPLPTLDKEPKQISAEKKESVFSMMETAKEVTGEPKYENFAENKKHIENMINSPLRPQALREAFAAAPELMAELVNSHINAVRAGLLKRANAAKTANDKKTTAGKQSAGASPSGSGSVSEGKAGAEGFLASVGKDRFGR